eukprot:1258044-Amphidinium_carterae.1
MSYSQGGSNGKGGSKGKHLREQSYSQKGGSKGKGMREEPEVLYDVPVSAWGFIIGKEGNTLKSLQEEFGVVIRVPPRDKPHPDARVTISGPAASRE